VELFVAPLLCGCTTELDPKVVFRHPIERFWCRGSTRWDGQGRFCHSGRGRGANLGHVVQRHADGRRCERTEVNATSHGDCHVCHFVGRVAAVINDKLKSGAPGKYILTICLPFTGIHPPAAKRTTDLQRFCRDLQYQTECQPCMKFYK